MQVPYEHFAKVISEKNLTSYRIAKETGLTTTLFTDWKRGKSSPKMDKLQKIAEYLDVPISYLVDGTPFSTSDYSQKKEQLVDLIKNLTPDEIKKLAEYRDFLLSQRDKKE